MKHIAGNHAQSHCRIRFTHFLCNGYRYDNAATLSQMGIDVLSIEGKVEILCSCSCHDHGQMAIEQPQKFKDAFETTLEIFGTMAQTRDSDTNHVVMLAGYLGIIAAPAADDILNGIESNRRKLGPVIAYTVYEQCYFFFLHLALRIAFKSGGAASRDLVQDSLSPVIFRHVPAFLNARFKSEADSNLTAESMRDLEEEFWPRLDRSEREYFQEHEYERLKDQLAERLMSALIHSGVELDSSFVNLVKQAVSQRGNNIEPLVKNVVSVQAS